MRTFLILLFFVLRFSFSHSQTLVPYYDRAKGKWGFQDKETKKVEVQPQFDNAVAWWKDYGIVMSEGKYGLIDKSGNKVSPFILDYIYVKDCEGCGEEGRLTSEANYVRTKYTYTKREFFINEKCECVPQPFYPCPPLVKMDTSSTTENLRILQRAEFHLHLGDVRKAMQYAENAIDADTNEASTYFWKAMHQGYLHNIAISDSPESMIQTNKVDRMTWEYTYNEESKIWENRLASSQSDHITQETYDYEMKLLNEENESMKKKFEKREREIDSLDNHYNTWLDQGLDYINMRFDTSLHLLQTYDAVLRKSKHNEAYYSTLAAKMELGYISKSEKRKNKREIIGGLPRKYRKGESNIMASGGFAIFPYQKWEANLTHGYSSQLLESHFFHFIAWGLGYEQSLESDLTCMKAMIMMQQFGVLHIAFNFMAVSGFGNSAGGFRPEFGFSYSAFTVLYGYNFVSNSKFPGARGNMVGVRIHLPIWRENEFRKDLGSNLFR